MGMTDEAGLLPTAEFLAAFRARAGAAQALTFAQYMELALYDPGVGYYVGNRARVGRKAGTDFYTSSSLGPVFGELVASACENLLDGADPGDFTFVEIGAEPDAGARGGVLEGVPARFGAAIALGKGDRLDLRGKCVVFSNELFDAQPFNRYVYRAGSWRELGVAVAGTSLVEIELPGATPAALPPSPPEGYVFDAPLGAVRLLDEIAAQPWTGVFVACDYGKTWAELAAETPAGTARSYRRHVQSNDLLAHPGRRDITCHVCWDWLSGGLAGRGFENPRVDSQEAFFVRHAGSWLAGAVAAEAARFSPRKAALQELIHPARLGQKFQVLHGLRRKPPAD